MSMLMSIGINGTGNGAVEIAAVEEYLSGDVAKPIVKFTPEFSQTRVSESQRIFIACAFDLRCVLPSVTFECSRLRVVSTPTKVGSELSAGTEPARSNKKE